MANGCIQYIGHGGSGLRLVDDDRLLTVVDADGRIGAAEERSRRRRLIVLFVRHLTHRVFKGRLKIAPVEHFQRGRRS